MAPEHRLYQGMGGTREWMALGHRWPKGKGGMKAQMAPKGMDDTRAWVELGHR